MKRKGSAMAKGLVENDDWRVEDDLRTLCSAEKIRKDPKRFKACQELAKKKMTEMGGLAAESSKV